MCFLFFIYVFYFFFFVPFFLFVTFFRGVLTKLGLTLSMGQLLEKGFTMHMQYDHLEVLDSNQRKILRVPLAQNRTFHIQINNAENQCLYVEVVSDSWLWHLRFDHLKFTCLSLLKSKEIICCNSNSREGMLQLFN